MGTNLKSHHTHNKLSVKIYLPLCRNINSHSAYFCQNKTRQLTIQNYTFERDENFKYIGVIPNEDNDHHTDLQERIKNANKTFSCYRHFLDIKMYLKN